MIAAATIDNNGQHTRANAGFFTRVIGGTGDDSSPGSGAA
jgi:hypothetical protein